MINPKVINGELKYCCEDISLIENYCNAIKDTECMWHLHHRLETHDRNGNKREANVSKKELIESGFYYNRPANELIFLKAHDHFKLHYQNNQYAKGRILETNMQKVKILEINMQKEIS